MSKLSMRSIIALLLCAATLLSLASCGSKKATPSEPDIPEPGPAIEEAFFFINPLPVPDGSEFISRAPRLTQTVQEKAEINSDVVGWLQIPNMDVNDVVLWYPGDRNEYYLRRNFEKRTYWNGCFFADYRCKFDGTAAGLSQNTVIYGHNLDKSENQDSPMFGQLLKFRDPEFAKAIPYIYFSTPEEDLAWEIFAVSYVTTTIPYNLPNMEEKQLNEVISEMRKRSIYNYDVQVSANDKILSLSTCTYEFTSSYPNNYRYVVMAKLVGDNEPLRQQAALEINPSPKEP